VCAARVVVVCAPVRYVCEREGDRDRKKVPFNCYDSFICVTWVMHMCAVTHPYV